MTTQSRVKALDDAKYEIGDVSLSNKILGYVTVAAIAIYLIWRIGFTLPFSYGYVTVALGLLLFICELISGVQAMANYLEQIRPLPLERPELPDSWYPDVDILIATHDEEINLIYNTLNACTYIEYPDKSKVHVHLCDDTNRPEMRALAEKLGVNYISMEKPQHAKAGNMNHALLLTHSPLVAFLDADMIPRREFLTTLVPYFFLPQFKKNEKGDWVERAPEEIDPDYKIGFVQSPQNFYNPDLFQFNLYAENRIPNEQIYFFREINVSRNRSNATHMCGSNMVISRAALAEAGYFATNNITEDHETGIKIQAAGYTTYAIPNCLANGLNPPAVVNLIIQRERWGRGCMQTMYNVRPLTDRRFSIVTRINYLCTLLYWLTFFCRFIYIMAPIVVTLFNVFILECSLGELLAIWLPYYLLHTIAMSRISSKTRTNNWSNTVDTIMFPFLVVPILMDMVGIRLTRFKVTDKSFQRNTSGNPILVLPHILLFAASVVGIVISLFNIIQYRAFYNVIILFWLLVNAKSLLLAIFFMLGRINERYYYRFYTSVPAELESNGIVHKCVTGDLSEGGLSLKFTFPAYIKQDSPITVRLYDRIYKAEMRCSLVQIEQGRDGIWTYGMKLEEIDDKNLSQYRQIIYERDPSLPETVNETIPIIEDIKVNIDKRFSPGAKMFSRKMPRIQIPILAFLPDGNTVVLDDFNYHYVRVNPAPHLAVGETLTLRLRPGVEIILGNVEDEFGPSGNLFAVVNWELWTIGEEYRAAVEDWIKADRFNIGPLPQDPDAIPEPPAPDVRRRSTRITERIRKFTTAIRRKLSTTVIRRKKEEENKDT